MTLIIEVYLAEIRFAQRCIPGTLGSNSQLLRDGAPGYRQTHDTVIEEI